MVVLPRRDTAAHYGAAESEILNVLSSLRDAAATAASAMTVGAMVVYAGNLVMQYFQIKGKMRRKLREKLPHRKDIDMDQDFNEYELKIADDIVASKDLTTTFDMIGGMDEMKGEIRDLITLCCLRHLLGNKFIPPHGILLCGKPGTGKTMLAKAIAKEFRATFINVRQSSLLSKWYGDSNKHVAAIFSLAKKLSPSIIFMDEIDGLMRTRGGVGEDIHMLNLKAEFMSLWDGVLTDNKRTVLVLGTTNRPQDVDEAILRRLPRQFEVQPPRNPQQRKEILKLLMSGWDLAQDVNLDRLADLTPEYSGSDLKELCNAARSTPLREFSASINHQLAELLDSRNTPTRSSRDSMQLDNHGILSNSSNNNNSNESNNGLGIIRQVCWSDFVEALEKVKPTGDAARQFVERRHTEERATRGMMKPSDTTTLGDGPWTPEAMAIAMKMLQTLLSANEGTNTTV
ncbi:unnamed protein product [Discosporangium mesarthrocarpum]